MSRRNLFRHVKVLIAAKVLVTLSLGGTLSGKNYANSYGIPASPGTLDQRACKRAMVQMLKGEDGVYRPHVVHGGEQSQLFSKKTHDKGVVSKPHGGSDKVARGVVSNCHGGSVKVARGGSVKVAHHHNDMVIPSLSKDHDHGVATRRKKTERKKNEKWLPCNITVAQLQSSKWVRELWWEAQRRGLIEQTDDAAQYVQALAAHALRKGNNPPALFVSLANVLPERRGMYLSQDDDREGQRRFEEDQQRSNEEYQRLGGGR